MPGQAYGASEETRMLTATTPIARARSRAQGVLGQIRRLFVSHGGGDFVGTEHHAPSPALAAAIAPSAGGMVYASGGTLYEDYSPAGVARVAGDLREKTAELKKKAETKGEKATIEIVAGRNADFSRGRAERVQYLPGQPLAFEIGRAHV